MKHTKSLLIAALAALSIGSASAETIYITGSTAFRSAANATLYGATGISGKLYATDKSTTSDVSANNLIFTNCTVNSQTVDVVVFWSGSEAGIQVIAGTNGQKLPFFSKALLAANYPGVAPITGATGGSQVDYSNSTNTILTNAQIAFSDTFQASSVFNGIAADGYNYQTLGTPATVGVVPFSFCANKGCPYTNMTPAIFGDMAAQGYQFADVFTGVASDTNTKVWLFGRNPDSGTRVSTFKALKYGSTTVAKQLVPTIQSIYYWTNTATNGLFVYTTNNNTNDVYGALTNNANPWTNTSTTTSITNMAWTPAATIDGISVAAGNNGEAVGGTLVAYLNSEIAASGNFTKVLANVPAGLSQVFVGTTTNYAITYAGCSDIAGLYGKGVVWMSYNGIVPRCYNNSTKTVLDEGYTNIISGKYPFWTYEEIYTNPSSSAQVGALFTTLTNTIAGYTSSSTQLAPNIALGDMKVKRGNVDQGIISPK